MPDLLQPPWNVRASFRWIVRPVVWSVFGVVAGVALSLAACGPPLLYLGGGASSDPDSAEFVREFLVLGSIPLGVFGAGLGLLAGFVRSVFDETNVAPPAPRPAPQDATPLAFVAFVPVALGGSVPVGRLALIVASLYAAMSVATFVAYAKDKAAAGNERRRTSENTLHVLSLAGGWPGALVAQQVLRHKTQKQPFRTIFWVTVVANVVAVAFAFAAYVGLL